jgi:ABC-type multidrug transport system fused ATPase/permease subunit
MLIKPKILVMDEATASLDYETDQRIKVLIQREFPLATTLTIAHRLDTIMNSDRIMVLEGGSVVEFDTPDVLLSKQDGYLVRLMQSEEASKQGLINDVQ